jgi:hypothetical protein
LGWVAEGDKKLLKNHGLSLKGHAFLAAPN